MPIEFDCTQCGQRLRTPDDTAGKQARCPGCNSLVPIPSQSQPLGDAADSDRFAASRSAPDPNSAPNPFADPPPVNPYQAPVGPIAQAALSPAEARAKLLGPAIGMIAGAVLSILYSVFNLAITFTFGVDQLGAEMPDDPMARAIVPFILGVIYLVMFIVPILVIFGAVAMLRLKSYALAKTGAIMALFPCHCCFVISLPFGIWGLTVLNDVNVRAAFQTASE